MPPERLSGISMFAVLAFKVKQNALRCHTFLKIILKRLGTDAHRLHFLCSSHEHTSCQSTSSKWKCRCNSSHWDECLCGGFLDSLRCLRVCYPRWTKSDFSV